MAHLKKLTLKGFRNLDDLNLNFDAPENIVAFLGKNGQGKTNLLESIYLCALSKSFRGKNNADLIHFEKAFCQVTGEDSNERKLSVIITKQPPQKALKINDVKITAPDFIGQLKAVFFSPDDLTQISYAPKLRRRYLDVLLTQLQIGYLEHLMAYEEARKQRNALLRRLKEAPQEKDQLLFWDEKLAQHGCQIIKARLKLLNEIKPWTQKHYQSIAKSEDQIELKYQNGQKSSEEMDENRYLDILKKNEEKDLITGRTQWGPHVDDIEFFLSEKDMQRFASRGEWRSLVLALKFAELDLLREKTGEEPILLLDDVFSELDEVRQEYLFQAIGQTQTFLTTTHEVFFEPIKDKVRVYRVEEGKVL